jgi:hypothetical protein
VSRAIGRSGEIDIYSDESRRALGAEFLAEAYRRPGVVHQRKAAESRRVLETYSTPFLYAVFRPFSTADYDGDLGRYRLLQLASMMAAVLIFGRLFGYSREASLAAILVFTVWFEPFSSDLRTANIGSLQLLSLAILTWLLKGRGNPLRWLAGGAVLGFSVMFKPNIAAVMTLLVFTWLVNRRYLKLAFSSAGILAAVAAAFLYSSLVFGTFSCWARWLDALRQLPEGIIRVEQGNYSFAMIVSGRLGLEHTYYVGILLFSAALIFLLRGRGSGASGSLGDGKVTALALLIMLLSSGLAWLHYFILAVPAALLLLRPPGPDNGQGATGVIMRQIPVLCAVAALAIRPVLNLGMAGSVSRYAALTCLGTLVLFGFMLREVSRPVTK